MKRISTFALLATVLTGCASTQPGQTLYEIPYQGSSYPVIERYPAGQSLSQARVAGLVEYEVLHPKRGMTCNGSVEDCRATLTDLVDRVEALGDGRE